MAKTINRGSELFDMLRVYRGLNMIGSKGGAERRGTAERQAPPLPYALLFSPETFREVFFESPCGMLMSRAEDGSTYEVNNAFCAMTGYSREQLVNNAFIHNYLNQEACQQIFKEVVANQRIVNREIRIYDHSYVEHCCLLNAELVQFNEQYFILIALIELNDSIGLIEEPENVGQLRLMAELAASLAHEVRNPMTTVRGFLQIMREKKEYAVDYDDIDLMLTEIDQANFAISQLLFLTREKALELELGNLNGLIRSIASQLEMTAAQYHKKLIFALEDIIPFPMDEQEITQLLLTLVNNSLQVLPSGDTLKISTFSREAETILVGESLSSYETLNNDNKSEARLSSGATIGTGLSLCHSIAARHDALLQFRNKPHGEIFKVVFKNQEMRQLLK